MDLATLIGIVLGIGLIIGAMLLGGSIMAFVNAPGLLIVVGGTIAATLINESMGLVAGAAKVYVQAFFEKAPSATELIDKVVDLAAKARKEGLVSLEGEDIPDPFLARGVQLGVDGLAPEIINGILEGELKTLKSRHGRSQAVFKFMASTAPAMGMIGTLIGLVQMLQAMEDPAAIGPAMAVALLTTLYGAILAFVLFAPIASKLETRTKSEVAHKTLAIIGVESILKGDNSMVIQSKLDAYLSPADREAKAAEK
ncbi:MAG: motility protein A [bacterium]|nr:motility protein A [bacterium]